MKVKKGLLILSPLLVSTSVNLKYDLNKFWEYHYIFHKLFARYDQIKILQKSNKGFSGTDVFYVIPYADGVEYSVHIVKIGARDIIELEANNFQEWIQWNA